MCSFVPVATPGTKGHPLLSRTGVPGWETGTTAVSQPGQINVFVVVAIACQHERKYIVSNNSDALHGKEMKMSPRKSVYIGAMQVEIIDAFPT